MRVEVTHNLVPGVAHRVLVALLLPVLDVDDLLVQMEQRVQHILLLGREARRQRQLTLGAACSGAVVATAVASIVAAVVVVGGTANAATATTASSTDGATDSERCLHHAIAGNGACILRSGHDEVAFFPLPYLPPLGLRINSGTAQAQHEYSSGSTWAQPGST